MFNEAINDIIKEYPDMYRVIIYKTPYEPKKTSPDKTSKSKSLHDPLERSVRRTKRVLHDYVRCNDFDLFVTFTFSPRKVNRYSIDATYMKMIGWLNRQRRNNPDMKYLIVPERHKDGAIHFHGLFSEADFILTKTNVIQDSRRVFNIPSFRFGFTNATKLPPEDKQKAGNYIAKYITKDMIVMSNRRRYWSSKNLEKPITYRNALYDFFSLKNHINTKNLVADTDYNVVYEVPISQLD